MNFQTFQDLPAEEVARLVREAGPKVCVFPINGTRRWFMLEYMRGQGEDLLAAYLEASIRRHIELYTLFFEHGIDTLLTPAFGPDLMERSQDYLQVASKGLARLATDPVLLDFYKSNGVRVRFYGDHRKYLGSTPYAYLSDLFDEAAAQTAHHDRHRLFFGLFSHDPSETVAELAVQYYIKHGAVPDRRKLVELYYGEYVAPVDFFIGFEKFSAFDMPLLALGNEDLYFTVSPSPYLNAQQLRAILYDHLYSRRVEETDYSEMGTADWAAMRDFYRANAGNTLGIGAIQKRGGFWYPLPQVALPPGFTETQT